MTVDQVFTLVNTAVLPGWLILIVFPKWRLRNGIIYSLTLALAVLYGAYVVSGLSTFDPAAFSTLAGVKQLFTVDQAVLAGWIHYLAFDLLIGNWVVNQSIKHGIKHYFIIPCLFFCFMFGPIGYLLFQVIKILKTKRVE